VLLDWFRTTDIYLGQGVALIGRGAHAASLVRFPSTLPLSRALPLFRQQAPELLGRGARVRVRLSCALCRLVQFEVPETLKRWNDLEAPAVVQAAASMGIPPGDIAITLDQARLGRAAALARLVAKAIGSWAEQEQLALVSLGPLWGEASRCPAARRRSIQAISVREQDGTTDIGSQEATTPSLATLEFQLTPLEGSESQAPRFLRSHWRVA
jgi:hypothetical protein